MVSGAHNKIMNCVCVYSIQQCKLAKQFTAVADIFIICTWDAILINRSVHNVVPKYRNSNDIYSSSKIRKLIQLFEQMSNMFPRVICAVPFAVAAIQRFPRSSFVPPLQWHPELFLISLLIRFRVSSNTSFVPQKLP